MPISITCPSCGKTGRVPDDAKGKTIKCPKCGNSFGVQAPIEASHAGNLASQSLASSSLTETQGVGWRAILLNYRRPLAIGGIVVVLALLAIIGYQWMAEGSIVYQGKSLREWKGLLTDLDPRARFSAVDALKGIGKGGQPSAVVPTLLDVASSDSDSSVRNGAVSALSAICYDDKTPSAIRSEVLSRLTQHLPEEQDGRVATVIVGVIGGIISREKPELTSSSTRAALDAIKEAVGHLDIDGTQALFSFVKTYPELLEEVGPLLCSLFSKNYGNFDYAYEFEKWLGTLPDGSARRFVPCFIDILKAKTGNSGVGVNKDRFVIPFLFRFGSPEDFATGLVAALGDDEPFVSNIASEELIKLGPTAVPYLIRVLQDRGSSADHKYSAVICLRKMGPAAREALPDLKALLMDGDPTLTMSREELEQAVRQFEGAPQ
jgi:hypothetical protein